MSTFQRSRKAQKAQSQKAKFSIINHLFCSLSAAPSVPVIDTERCTIMWDSATLRWSSTKQSPEQSYTLEYCRQYEVEGEGLRWVFPYLIITMLTR